MADQADAILNALNQGAAFGSNFRQVSRKRRIDEILGKYFTPAGTEQVSVPQYDEAGNELAAMMQPQATPARFDYQNAIADLGREAPMEALMLQNQQDDRATARLLAEAKLKAAKSGADLPSSWREWLLYKDLPDSGPYSKPEYLGVKRGMYDLRNIAGVEHLVGKHPSLATQPLSTLAQEVAGQSAVAGGKTASSEAAKAAATAKAELDKKTLKADSMTTYIGEAEKLLDSASSGYLGTGWAKAKGAVGVSDPETQANQQLKLISGWMVSNVPRMEGPQSDFDVKNYREMAAMVGDSTIPIGDRKAALMKLRDL